MKKVIRDLEKDMTPIKNLDPFKVGDTIEVHLKFTEIFTEKQRGGKSVSKEKERVQVFTGTVISRKNAGIRESFTVRRLVQGEGVERTFPINAPIVQAIKVIRKGKVRRAKLYYLRDRTGKATKVKERFDAKKPAKEKAEAK